MDVLVKDIQPSADGTGGGVNYMVTINFSDAPTGFASTKVYAFAANTTLTTAKNVINVDANTLKTQLSSLSTLKNNIGASWVV